MIQRLLLLLSLLIALPAAAEAKGGVVSAGDPRAAAAGQAILRAGGTATDAAMAVMLALGVVEPQSSGIGGGGFLLHSDPQGGIATIDGRETAPAAGAPDRFLKRDGTPMGYAEAMPGGLSVGVPGNIRLMAKAHARWGRLPWARLFDPAIRLAEGGFAVTPRFLMFMGYVDRNWADFPATAALYHPGGRRPVVGTVIRNPALAATLRRIARQGPDAFYKGPIAAGIATAVASARRNPAALTVADLAGYEAKDRPAVCAAYRGYRLCGMGPPSAGAMTVLQILGMLERFNLKALGPANPVSWHLIGEAMQLAYADRDKYLADADFVAVPLAGLLDRDYLARRALLISPASSLPAYPAGSPPGAPARTAAASSEVSGTTHFVVTDGAGEVVTMTSTVEGPFGSQILSQGMMLNNELTDFTFAPEQDGAPVANRVQAGKRPLSSMAPTIVYDPQGRAVLALGSGGGKRIPMHVLKTLVGVIDWGLPVQAAIALPNIYFGGGALLVEKSPEMAVMVPALAKLGQPVTPSDLTSKVNAIEWTPAGWRGAADPRSEGVALGE
ncbi:gamma-glutamyltransferase [Sphingomonas profundi]|uniref:gamma-glutamyltransferase n=1 Tax=Alterirhizorhabdus profundi TaxID=2681549 RepID=UPI0012E87294|nr:gamma-glutamyltransferase [Sphingomonas profundi]